MSPFFSVVSLSLKPLSSSRPPFPNPLFVSPFSFDLSRPPFPSICLKTCPTATSFLHPKFLELSQLSIHPRHIELSSLFFGVFCRRLEGILLPWLIFFFFVNFFGLLVCPKFHAFCCDLWINEWVWCPVVFTFDMMFGCV